MSRFTRASRYTSQT